MQELFTKDILRNRIFEKRKMVDQHEEMKNSSKIIEYLLESTIYYRAKHIMTYLSYPHEVRTDELVTKSLNLKKKVSIPVCIKETKDLMPSQSVPENDSLLPTNQ